MEIKRGNVHMIMKKTVLTALVSTLAFSSLIACAGKDEQPGNASNVTANKGPMSFTMTMKGRGTYLETTPNINEDKMVKKLKELTKTNLNLELIMEKDYEQKMILKFSSGDIPDVVMTSGSIYGKELAGAVQSGVFMTLDDLLKKYGQNLLKKIPQAAWDRVKYQGKIVAIPEFLSIPNTNSTYLRKDLLDKLGLQTPKTVDEYLNVLRAFKKNGTNEPFLVEDKFVNSDLFFGAYDVLPSQFELVNGQVVPKFFKVDAMMKAIQVNKTLLDEGLISKEFPSNNGNNRAQNVYAGSKRFVEYIEKAENSDPER
jgi:putative aldouronate transport system substrate-binding protein